MDVVSKYKYTKLARIDGGEGQNSLGVYRAFDPQVHGEIAVKEIDKNDFPSMDEYFREAQAMFRSDHPNVVPVRVATQTKKMVCLCMPIFKNGSLARQIADGPLALAEAVRVTQQVLAGLGAIHGAQTVHFDIKPTNILFSNRWVAMIADFGQARVMGAHGVTLMPKRMYAPGTPPEAFTNARRGTNRSDIYQVGLTAYRTLNGEPMFTEQWNASALDIERQIVAGRFPRRDVFMPHVPDRLRRVVRKAMNCDPSKRFESPEEFSNSLANVTIVNDWKASIDPNGDIEWRLSRDETPDLVVEMTSQGGRYDVEIHTVNDSGKPRRTRTNKWLRGARHKDAMRHLDEFFASLE